MMTLSTTYMLDSIKDAILERNMATFMATAGMLACILGAISVLGTIRDYIRGADLDAWDTFKPIFIMLLVCHFDMLVLGPIDAVTNLCGAGLVSMTDTDNRSFLDRWSRSLQQVAVLGSVNAEVDYQKELEEIAEDRSMFGRFFAKAGLAFKKFLRQMLGVKSMTFAGIVGGILFFIAKVLLFCQQELCTGLLIITALIGPFTLALQVLPSFSTSFRSWVARYVQISLWIPVGYFIMDVSLSIMESAMSPQVGGVLDLGVEWLLISLQIVCIVFVAAVPKIVAYVIESSGANDAHGAISNPLRAIGRKVAKL